MNNTNNKIIFSNRIFDELYNSHNFDAILALSKKDGFFQFRTRRGFNALHLACIFNYSSLVEEFIKSGADINSTTTPIWKNDFAINGFEQTPLHLCALLGHNEIADILLQYKADLSLINTHGDTALHIASEKGNNNLIKTLINHGADINSQNRMGMSPFHRAYIKDISTIEIFLNHGFNINSQDLDGNTLLHKVCYYNSYNNSSTLVIFLITNNANINIKNLDNNTPLSLVRKSNNSEKDYLIYLLENPVNIINTYQNYTELKQTIDPIMNKQILKKIKI